MKKQIKKISLTLVELKILAYELNIHVCIHSTSQVWNQLNKELAKCMLDNTQAYTQEGFIVSNSNIMLLQNYSLEVIGVWKGKNIKSIHKYLRADSSSKVEIEIFSNCRFFLLIRDAKSLGVLIYTLTIMMLQCFDNQNYPTPLGKAIECFIDKLLNVGLL